MAKRRSSYDDYWPQYEPSRPIPTVGGIKARSQRGRFVEHWWADQWIKALTGFMDTGRLSRGRSYARGGQVLNIDVQPGLVSARVQGSRRTPYRVKIALQPLSDAQWERVLDALAGQALFAAQLLNGEMPADVEQVFQAVQVSLFPARRGDLATECSCPDPANPCKHIAAVVYLLGERFDQDPFLLFALRGRSQEQVAAALRARRAGQAEALHEPPAAYALNVAEPAEAPALEESLDTYWDLDPEVEEMPFHLAPPPVETALLKRLGVPDFLDGARLGPQWTRVYAGVTERALEAAFADQGAQSEEAARRERLAVLTMIQEGKISAEEGEMLLLALEG